MAHSFPVSNQILWWMDRRGRRREWTRSINEVIRIEIEERKKERERPLPEFLLRNSPRAKTKINKDSTNYNTKRTTQHNTDELNSNKWRIAVYDTVPEEEEKKCSSSSGRRWKKLEKEMRAICSRLEEIIYKVIY